jgi:hypothetical protein
MEAERSVDGSTERHGWTERRLRELWINGTVEAARRLVGNLALDARIRRCCLDLCSILGFRPSPRMSSLGFLEQQSFRQQLLDLKVFVPPIVLEKLLSDGRLLTTAYLSFEVVREMPLGPDVREHMGDIAEGWAFGAD